MQTGNDQDKKVISLSERSQKPANQTEQVESATDFDWENVQKRNNENLSRLKKEREKANKGVIRSYRLKH